MREAGHTFGRRLMLQTGLSVFALASPTAALALTPMMLIVSRGVQGLGAAFIATAALSLLRNAFAEGAERNRALGVRGALSGVAAVAGVTVGGLLTEGPGWPWIFYVNVPIGPGGALPAPFVAALVLLPFRKAPERNEPPTETPHGPGSGLAV
ncbi:MFS family permease [Nocardiopsis arvandica]|uniref:MFS family permease n=1 Tax=Nocardiopsis sinuspersici TaxID=501010 RepID=A0A7Y9XCN7_9ACTN|nr:MFS family permease [Nocardiopsis sinuspersici]